MMAAIGAEVNPSTFVAKIGNFVSYFDRIATLESGARVWSDIGEWFWGWRKWLALLGETILISYVGTLGGRCWRCPQFYGRGKHLARALAALYRQAADGVLPDRSRHRVRADLRHGVRPGPDGRRARHHDPLGRRARQTVLRDRREHRHEAGEGVWSTGASWVSCMRFAVVPQVAAGFASYTLLRFEINVRGASVMGFVGAGGIGQELVVAIRKFYYSDVSAILLMIIVTVFVIDIGTGWVRGRLFGKDARA